MARSTAVRLKEAAVEALWRGGSVSTATFNGEEGPQELRPIPSMRPRGGFFPKLPVKKGLETDLTTASFNGHEIKAENSAPAVPPRPAASSRAR